MALFLLRDPGPLQEDLINMRVAHVGIGREHIGPKGSPVLQLDHAFRNLLLHHVRHPAMPDEIWKGPLLKAGLSDEFFQEPGEAGGPESK